MMYTILDTSKDQLTIPMNELATHLNPLEEPSPTPVNAVTHLKPSEELLTTLINESDNGI